MTTTLIPNLVFRALNASGVPLAGGKLFTYAAGTANLLATYTDSSGGTPNTNPVILNADGEASVWLGNNAYKFNLLDASNVQQDGFPVDNVVRYSSYAELAALTNALASSTGASNVNYTIPASGAILTSVYANIIKIVFLKGNFGAVGNGVADDTLAWQNAINYCMLNNYILWVEKGTYKVATTLSIYNPDNARKSGLTIIGSGQETTIVNSYVSVGPLFNVRGVPNTGPVATTFFWGGAIEGIQFNGVNHSGSAPDFMKVLGWYHGVIRNCRILNFPRHGVVQIDDTVVDPNPDFTSSILTITQCSFERLGGIGVYQSAFIAAPSWDVNNNSFTFCAQGGAVMTSGGCKVNSNGFSGCGFVNETTPYAGGNAYGLQIGTVLGTLNNMEVSYNEFDTSLTAHIYIYSWQGLDCHDNRFIHNDRYGAGYLTPPIGINITSSSSDVAKDLFFRDSFFRIDTVGTMTGFLFNSVSNVSNVQIDSSTFSDQTSGAATITKYSGYEASNQNLRANYFIREAGQVISTGKPDPFILASTLTGSIATSYATVLFGTVDTVCNQIYSTTFYNPATGIYTTGSNGYYDIAITFSVASLAAADLLTLQLNYDGTSREMVFCGSANAATTVTISTRVFSRSGQGIYLNAKCSNSRNISTTYPSVLSIKLGN